MTDTPPQGDDRSRCIIPHRHRVGMDHPSGGRRPISWRGSSPATPYREMASPTGRWTSRTSPSVIIPVVIEDAAWAPPLPPIRVRTLESPTSAQSRATAYRSLCRRAPRRQMSKDEAQPPHLRGANGHDTEAARPDGGFHTGRDRTTPPRETDTGESSQ